MLSEKIAFSLMRLITIFTLVSVAPSAIAGEFGVSVDMTGDVSSAGDLQLVYPGISLEVIVKFDQAVVFAASKAFVTTYDEDGKLVSIPAATVTPATAFKDITLTIPVTAAVTKVNIKIAAGIASADPINGDTSAALDVNIHLVAADEGAPTVYSIRRADNPLLPVTSATVQVIILLSEKAKAFTKDHVSVSNATHDEPVALGAIPETDNMPSTGRDDMLYPYVLTITPKYESKNDIVVRVKAFEDMVLPTPNRYTPPSTEAGYRKRSDELTIKVDTEVVIAKPEGFEVALTTDKIIPNQAVDGANTPDAAHVIPQADVNAMAVKEKEKSDATAAAAKVADTSVSVPTTGRIYISEIMFTGGGRLPQWIEIANSSRTEQVNLSGWTLTVENETTNTNAFVKATAKFRIPQGTQIDPSGQHDTPSTLLVVSRQGRTNLDGRIAERSGRQPEYFQTRLRTTERCGIQNNTRSPREIYCS